MQRRWLTYSTPVQPPCACHTVLRGFRHYYHSDPTSPTSPLNSYLPILQTGGKKRTARNKHLIPLALLIHHLSSNFALAVLTFNPSPLSLPTPTTTFLGTAPHRYSSNPRHRPTTKSSLQPSQIVPCRLHSTIRVAHRRRPKATKATRSLSTPSRYAEARVRFVPEPCFADLAR